MTKNQPILSNLVGEFAKITMSMTDGQIVEHKAMGIKNERGAWRYLGQEGNIRAVYLTAENQVELLLELADGNVVECYASHVRIIRKAPPPIR